MAEFSPLDKLAQDKKDHPERWGLDGVAQITTHIHTYRDRLEAELEEVQMTIETAHRTLELATAQRVALYLELGRLSVAEHNGK